MSAIEAAFFGSLGRDAEQRTSKPGRPYLLLNVRMGEGDGAQWVNVRCFDKDAVEIADKFAKGARVYVEGKLSLNEWITADGVVKAGLSCMSFHTRLSQIGRQKAKHADDKIIRTAAERLNEIADMRDDVGRRA